MRHINRTYWLACFGLCFIGLMAYWPGLQGPFLLDDFYNLSPLGDAGGVHDWRSALRFVWGNGSGPLGRPVSMASFLLNAQDWPAHPLPFKITSLVVHLLNACLLLGILLKILPLCLPGNRARWLALWVATAWLLHPLHVSGVLYVVQRMALLSAFFVLAGMLAYLKGRLAVSATNPYRYGWMLCGLLLGLVGMFAKENAALLVFFLLVLEGTVLAGVAAPGGFRGFRWLCLVVPAALLLCALLLQVPSTMQGVPFRGYSYGQHLLTVPRVLLDYLGCLLWPDYRGMGVFHDDFPVSRTLLEPWTVIPAMLVLAGLLGAFGVMRRRMPLLALGIGWFLAGHLMESSVIALELYFEHRNYLPAAGVLLGVAVLVERVVRHIHSRWVTGLAVVPLLALLGLSSSWSAIWSSELLLSAHMVQAHPQSVRAQRHWASLMESAKEPALADQAMAVAQTVAPGDISIPLDRIYLQCRYGVDNGMRLADWVGAPIDVGTYSILYTMELLVRHAYGKQCAGAPDQDIHRMMHYLEQDPLLARNGLLVSRLYFLHADTYIRERQLAPAMEALDKAYALTPSVDIALKRADILASAGLFPLALEALHDAREQDGRRRRGMPSREVDIVAREQVFLAQPGVSEQDSYQGSRQE